MAKLPYTLIVPPTPEDEAFEEIERNQQTEKAIALRHEAQDAAFDFTDHYDAFDLGGMTLRQAFEHGYRAAVLNMERNENG
jgi:tRNA(Glu) U13 pseudouridine synthase TruD